MKMSHVFTTFVQLITSGITRSEDILSSDHSKSGLSSQDSQLFEALCQFLWIQGDPLPLIFDMENEIYTKQGITLTTLKHLETIGLITFEIQGFVKKGLGKHTRLFYCGKPTKIGFQNDENNDLDLGHVLLTAYGKKLASNYKASKNQQFYEYVIRRWFQQGLVLSSIQIDRNRGTGFVHGACTINKQG